MFSKEFNIETAKSMARLSELAYSPELGRDPISFALSVRQCGFEYVCVLQDKDTDTQGFVAKNINYAVVVFRGTSGSIVDVATDAKVRIFEGKHEGFYKAFLSIENQMLTGLAGIGELPVLAAGHSLGGALAKMMVVLHPTLNWMGCYTFGSPPISTEDVTIDARIPIYRIVNEGDVVPRSLDLDDTVYEAAIGMLTYLSKIESNTSGPICNILTYINSTWPALKQYTHIGVIRIYNRDGLFLENEDSMKVFYKVLSLDIKRIIDDHSIVNYINALDRASNNNILNDLRV